MDLRFWTSDLLSPAPYIDHTLLRPEATCGQIRALCEEAVEYGFAAVCIPPVFVAQAHELLYGSGVELATVVGFPLGYVTPSVKAFEAAEAVAAGATEIDMVIHLGAVLDGRLGAVEGEIRKVVRASSEAKVKVILECSALTDPLKEALTHCAVSAGATFVKTSTGFSGGGATVDDVRLLARVSAGRIGVKASGGIRDLVSLREFLQAGAARIGTSAGVRIMEEWHREMGQ
jgi:deoxyribose-phosphate aldolase